MAAERRVFENRSALEHAAASAVLDAVLSHPGAETESAAAQVLVGLALHDDDPAFVELWCIRLGMELASGNQLLGLAGLCVGHLARRFGKVSDEAAALVVELARRSESDPADVDGRASDGLDDLRHFTQRFV